MSRNEFYNLKYNDTRTVVQVGDVVYGPRVKIFGEGWVILGEEGCQICT